MGKRRKTTRHTAVTLEQIESLNLNRIIILCAGCLAFELVNVMMPVFWKLPNLWPGAIYITLMSVIFICIVLKNRKHKIIHRFSLFNNIFWLIFIIGVFPFLTNDAIQGDKPLNCTVLTILLICGPILNADDLNVVFAASLAVNIVAAIAAGRTDAVYVIEVSVITTGAYLLARNLHGRYFRLLEEQKKQYDELLQTQTEQRELKIRLEKEKDTNAAKSRFLSLMSHDLRTPLGAVIGLSGLAADEKLPQEEVRRYLDDIHRSGEYLLGIIDDVLDMSKIENKKISLNPSVFSQSEFIETMRNVMDYSCREKGISFTINAPEENVYMLADKTRFNQVFVNLLTNAVKYTPNGGSIVLEIEKLPETAGKLNRRITVRDTGIGMSPEFIEHAFEPFSQEREDDQYSGTGLGLPIVKNMAELMGGTVKIVSTPGKGTAISVELMLDAAEEPPKIEKTGADGAKLDGKRILLCEDNNINAEIVTMILNSERATVDHAENGQQGVEMFEMSEVGTYDAILMDVRMPVMSGTDAARAIRAINRSDAKSVPILALTANAFDEDKRHCIEAGMNGHLSKPVDSELLKETLCKYMQN